MKVLKGHNDGVLCVAITPDGHFAISGGRDKTVRLWNLHDGTCTIKRTADKVTSVCITTDGLKALIGDQHGVVQFWDIERGSANVFPLRGILVCVTADGKRALIGGAGRQISTIDLRTMAVIGTLSGHVGDIESLAISADGKLAVSVGSASLSENKPIDSLLVWDVEKERLLGRLQGAISAKSVCGFVG